jgi:hypothetical protein
VGGGAGEASPSRFLHSKINRLTDLDVRQQNNFMKIFRLVIVITSFLGSFPCALVAMNNRPNVHIPSSATPSRPDVLPWLEQSPTPPGILEPALPGHTPLELLGDQRSGGDSVAPISAVGSEGPFKETLDHDELRPQISPK